MIPPELVKGHQGIMEGSGAWERIRDGIDPTITDGALRKRLHDEAQVMSTLVGIVDTLVSENERLHKRIDRRGEDHEALKDKLFDPDEGSFAKLNDKLFNQKTGAFVDMRNYIDQKFGKFTGPLFALLGSVMAGLIMLAASRMTGGG